MVYEKYGKTFKKLRKQRGFKLTSFKKLGISPSALCKFERGISLLKFDKLVMALSELSITLSDYEKCLNDYDLDNHELLIQNIIISICKKDLEKISAMYEEALKIGEQYLAIAVKSNYSELNFEEREKVYVYFEQISFWRYTDLYTFYLFLDLLEAPQISFVITGFFSINSEVFNSIEHRNRVTHIICKAAMIFISNGYKEKSMKLLGYVLYKEYKHTMYTKNLLNFVLGFWEIEFGEKRKGFELMGEALKLFDLLSFPGVSDYYMELYNRYSGKSFKH